MLRYQMSDDVDETLSRLKKEVETGTAFFSDDEDEQFARNKEPKIKVLDFILESQSKYGAGHFSAEAFDELLGRALYVLRDNTGCAEDLEILEMVLDRLFDEKIIDSKIYEEIVSGGSVGRWL